MPIFTRRRVQWMLNELAPVLSAHKAKDLIARFENPRPEQSIAAEMELALLWAMKQVGDIIIDPECNGRTPDAYSKTLFDKPAYIEITTLSEGRLSGEDVMRRASQRMVEFANTVKRKSGKHLYFAYHEESGWLGNKYQRERCVAKDFQLDDHFKDQLRAWLKLPLSAGQRIRLKNSDTDVTVEWKDYVHPRYNFFSSMPALAYCLVENPIYDALAVKAKQLAGAPEGTLKCVFLADGGNSILRNLNFRDGTGLVKSGQEIIFHYLKQNKIDVICVFSPYRKPNLFLSSPHNNQLIWAVNCFISDHLQNKIDISNLEKVAAALPAPRVEGYQARSLHEQGLFTPEVSAGDFGFDSQCGEKHMIIKISARSVLDLLAGRIDHSRFQQNIFGDSPNLFTQNLMRGRIISAVHIEKSGLDKDDDEFVIEFVSDPAASKLSLPQTGRFYKFKNTFLRMKSLLRR